MRYFWILFCLYSISCRFTSPHIKSVELSHDPSVPKVNILPLGTIDSSYIIFLRKEIPKFYKVEIVQSAMVALPGFAFYKPRQRYIADSLLYFLRSRSANKSEYVLGITAKDISTSNGNIVNWGVMGLGYQPGNTCVISACRIKNNIKSTHQVFARFLKVALHELGHNFGLGHCKDQHCIMVDAEGKNKLDGEEKLCKNCTFFLQKKGFL